MALDIIGFGEPLIEFNQTSSAGEEANYRLGHGGDTSNAIIAAARQGASTGYLTALGDDAFGAMFIDLWKREGVDTRQVRLQPEAPTGIYFVTHGSAGHVFTYRRAGSAASRMTPDDLDAGYIASAKFLHVSGISQAISATACDTVFAAIDHARTSGVKVSFDTNLRLKLWPLARARAISNVTAGLADVIFPSLEDATVLTGLEAPDAVADFYLKLGVPLVVLKLGPDGVLVATAERRTRLTGHKVDTVDATGAGDTFDGAFLSRLVLGENPEAAARYANAAAALSTCGYGAVAPIPSQSQVLSFLDTADRSR
jgi:2-dehydro-3-deoxygluconokinase